MILHIYMIASYGSRFMHSVSCWQEQLPLPILATHPIVPSCLISHLTFIQFKGYQEFQDELKFVEYVLQNSSLFSLYSLCTCTSLRFKTLFGGIT